MPFHSLLRGCRGLWSSNALGDATRYDPRRLESPMCWPGGESGPWRADALKAPFGYVAWVCWRTGAA
jgi:hypothetical protein